MNKGIIYKYTSPSGKVYIGKTVNPSVRKRGHNHRSIKAKTKFGAALRKYGFENFEYEILFETEIMEDKTALNSLLSELEIQYIEQYDSYNNGYNCTKGGEGSVGYIPSEETKEKQRIASTGRKHTLESIEKMKLNRPNVPMNDATKEALLKANNKIVLQFSKSGELIQEWESVTIAAETLGIGRSAIYNCCNGRCKTTAGFIWKYPSAINIT